MSLSDSRSPAKAAWMLLGATALWGISFLLMKSLGQCQQKLAPGASTWFVSALSVMVRFGAAALILLVWNRRAICNLRSSELWQGAGLGVFGGLGLLFQMDGVQHAPASTAAFLTQFYCLLVPVFFALRKREWPRRGVASSCAMVLGGVAVLADFHWQGLRLGRGEAETIVASILFAAQILWLERPGFAANRTGPATLVMFVVVTLVILPVVFLTGTGFKDAVAAYSSPAAIAISGFLSLACTLGPYCLMNHWQSRLSATHASLIYCSEPLFTSVLALFFPAWISMMANIDYPNEGVTWRLLVGGGLITAANLFVFWNASHLKEGEIQKNETDLRQLRGD
jgi:drug/metabolite transporter (DMT)-like permease